VLKLSWDVANKSKNNNYYNGQTTITMTDDKKRIQALVLTNDCYKYVMDLTTIGVVITHAIKFVQTNKEKLTTMTTNEENNGKESKEPDYDEDKDQLEEKQEEETGELDGKQNNK
jgi:hypothetical protein